jgi:hypothetical protein
MRRLKVDKKTGFIVKDIFSPIVIRDCRGILFYTTEPLIPKVTEFNLPEGIYFVDSGTFVEASSPKDYEYPMLPNRERLFFPNPKNFNIRFAPNPNKCTVSWTKKLITFDTSFMEKPLPQLDFIIYHEYGHRLYKTEKYCDLYASYCMLKIGYNPSQISFAQIDSLSDKQEKRKEFVIDSI